MKIGNLDWPDSPKEQSKRNRCLATRVYWLGRGSTTGRLGGSFRDMSIATKTGDNGTTALMFGRRVPKTDPRVAAYGTCDELNAALGLVRAFCTEPLVVDAALAIQKELVTLMGELAVAAEDRERYAEKGFGFVTNAMVDALTAQIDHLEKDQKLNFEHWATPGSTQSSAVIDMARVTCRRAERHICGCREKGFLVSDEIVRYLNRLSDLCWLWARYVETRAGA
jgi:cob(I)alamin adenosyltransferase